MMGSLRAARHENQAGGDRSYYLTDKMGSSHIKLHEKIMNQLPLLKLSVLRVNLSFMLGERHFVRSAGVNLSAAGARFARSILALIKRCHSAL